MLGLEEIHQYDTYVPMVASVETNTSFDEAITLVVDALAPLGREYVSTLEEGLRRGRWCDRYETKGKRSGAFSSGCYGNPPYILMNYKADVFSDVYTLAHEAGHSMHTWYAQTRADLSGLRLPDFSGGSRLHFQRGVADPSSARKNDRPADARLPAQPADRRPARHALPADDVRRVREARPTRWRKPASR